MPPNWSARVLRAFLALWFVLSVGEPSAVQVCPMHGGGMLSALARGSRMDGMAMDGAPDAGHHAHSHAHSDAHSDAHSHAHTPATQHHCTCLDCCIGAGAVATVPPAPVGALAETLIPSAAPVIASAETLPRSGPPHEQPPGTGPPRT